MTDSTPIEWRKALFESTSGLGDLAGKVMFNVRAKLWLQIVVAMTLGIALGFALAPDGGAITSRSTAELITGWLVLPGQLFLTLIQMIVVPLVVSSIVLGVCSSPDPAYLRSISLSIVPYFLATTLVATCIGAGVSVLIQPGKYVEAETIASALSNNVSDIAIAPSRAAPSVQEQIVALIPKSPLGAALEESMLQMVVFSILVGVALASIPRRQASPLLALLGSTQHLSLQIVSWAMVLAPLAVFGLLSQITMRVGLNALVGISAYVGTVLLGLLLHLGFYFGVLYLTKRIKPMDFTARVKDAMLLAFSTSSSAAVMPLSLQIAEQKLGVRRRIAQFLIPLGATVNMDGTALYQVVATVFLAQVFDISLSPGEFVLVVATTVGASIGSPSTPGVGIVVLATVLQTVGVPTAGLSLIIGVDRILDMARTALNVTGDLTACTVMERWLPDSPEEALLPQQLVPEVTLETTNA